MDNLQSFHIYCLKNVEEVGCQLQLFSSFIHLMLVSGKMWWWEKASALKCVTNALTEVTKKSQFFKMSKESHGREKSNSLMKRFLGRTFDRSMIIIWSHLQQRSLMTTNEQRNCVHSRVILLAVDGSEEAPQNSISSSASKQALKIGPKIPSFHREKLVLSTFLSN